MLRVFLKNFWKEHFDVSFFGLRLKKGENTLSSSSELKGLRSNLGLETREMLSIFLKNYFETFIIFPHWVSRLVETCPFFKRFWKEKPDSSIFGFKARKNVVRFSQRASGKKLGCSIKGSSRGERCWCFSVQFRGKNWMLRILFSSDFGRSTANLVSFCFRELLGRSRCILLGLMQRGGCCPFLRENNSMQPKQGEMLSVLLRLSGGESEVSNSGFTTRGNALIFFSKSCWGTICTRPWVGSSLNQLSGSLTCAST